MTHDHDYRLAPFSADRIRAGVDLCRATLAAKQAVRDGCDPDDAADIAQGEAAARREISARKCPHCRANEGRPCVVRGTENPITGYHDSRMQEWQNGTAA